MQRAKKNKQYTIRLGKNLMESVERIAEDEKTTKTEIIRRAISSYLEGQNPGKDCNDGDNS